MNGVVFTVDPPSLPQGLPWPLSSVRPVGVLLLVLVALYWGISLWGKKQWTFKRWHLIFPNGWISSIQIVVAAADWLLAGAVLYALFPAQPNWPESSARYPAVSGFLNPYCCC